MLNNKINLEQPNSVSSQGEEVSQINVSRAEDNTTPFGSKLGKFKTSEALLQAYNNLQADYTKKCQTLSQLQREETDNNNSILPPQEKNSNTYQETNSQNVVAETSLPQNSFNWQTQAESFFKSNPKAEKYADKLARIIVEDKSIASSNNPLLLAWNKFTQTNFLDEQELASDENFLQKYIFNNESIKNKIIQDYFSSLNFSKTPPTLIASQKGSESVLTPVAKPKTIKEARKIVEDMLNS